MRTRGVDSCVDSAKTNRSPGLVFVNRFWLMWSWSSCRFVASGLKYSVGWPGSYSSLHDENLQRTKIFTNLGLFFKLILLIKLISFIFPNNLPQWLISSDFFLKMKSMMKMKYIKSTCRIAIHSHHRPKKQ